MLLLASNTSVLIAPPGFWMGKFAGLAVWVVSLDFWCIGERCTFPPRLWYTSAPAGQAGFTSVCGFTSSSVQSTLFSLAEILLWRALCSICIGRHHQRFKSHETEGTEHKPCRVVPDAFLNSVLAFAQQSCSSSTQSNHCILHRRKRAGGDKFQCLWYSP